MTLETPSKTRFDSMKVLVPNSLTLLGLCLGLTSIRFTIEGEWQWAVGAILVATLVDFFDGFSARILKSTSPLGAELDSLSDLICFGVAPAILLYHWTLHEAGWLGWGVTLLFTSCSALRLARFNTQTNSPGDSPRPSHIFQGVPAPSAAGLVLVPLYMSFELEWQAPLAPVFAGGLMGLVALLMVTTLPTFSLKKLTLQRGHRLQMFLGGLLGLGLFLTFPWVVLTLACLVYILTIPVSVVKYTKLFSMTTAQDEVSVAE